jgi:hypothetical protein
MWAMHAGTALLAVFLAGPALAAPPAPLPATDATDNAAIMARINAADPSLTPSPTSIDELVAVAELAERKLAAAKDPDDVGELLALVGTAREIAHGRTNVADHLCKLLAAASDVRAREGLPADLHTEAATFSDTARTTLANEHAGHNCPPADRPVRTVDTKPRVTPKPAVMPGPLRPSTDRVRRPKIARVTVAGGVLLGTATALTLGLVGVRVHRGRAGDELAGIRAEVDAAGGKTIAQGERIAELDAINAWTRAATVGLSVSAAVLGVVGVGLVAAGMQRRTEQARIAPYGGPQGGGLVLQGRF